MKTGNRGKVLDWLSPRVSTSSIWHPVRPQLVVLTLWSKNMCKSIIPWKEPGQLVPPASRPAKVRYPRSWQIREWQNGDYRGSKMLSNSFNILYPGSNFMCSAKCIPYVSLQLPVLRYLDLENKPSFILFNKLIKNSYMDYELSNES